MVFGFVMKDFDLFIYCDESGCPALFDKHQRHLINANVSKYFILSQVRIKFDDLVKAEQKLTNLRNYILNDPDLSNIPSVTKSKTNLQKL